MNSLAIVSYDAPAIEYATVKSVGSHKRKADGDSDEEKGAAVTGRVLCCIKAKPWGLDLGCVEGGAKLDFRKATLACELLLCDSDEAVATRSTEPLHFSVRPAKDGRTASVEVRISVLSSQLEGALFKLRFSLDERHSCDSEPIKVVSKKSQLDKGDKPVKRTRTTQVATRDAVLDMIQKVEEQQAATATLMGRMMAQIEALTAKAGQSPPPPPCESEDSEAAPLSPMRGVERLAQGLRCFAGLDATARHALGAHLRATLQPAELAAAHDLAADLACFGAPPPPPLSMDFRPLEFRTSLTGVNMGGLFDF